MENIKTLLFVAIVSLGFLFIHTNVWAVPNYGVATDSGTYFNEAGEEEANYISFFLDQFDGDGFVSGGEGNHGFGFSPGDGEAGLFVWTNQPNTETLLLAEYNFENNSLAFNGITFEESDIRGEGEDGQINGYTNAPYLAVSLGLVLNEVGGLNPGWSLLPSEDFEGEDPFNPGPFYVNEGTLSWVGLTGEDIGRYIFAGGDWRNEYEILQGGEFSPHTTSSIAVPEPATMSLLGIGLAGLAGIGVRRRISKNTVVSGS